MRLVCVGDYPRMETRGEARPALCQGKPWLPHEGDAARAQRGRRDRLKACAPSADRPKARRRDGHPAGQGFRHARDYGPEHRRQDGRAQNARPFDADDRVRAFDPRLRQQRNRGIRPCARGYRRRAEHRTEPFDVFGAYDEHHLDFRGRRQPEPCAARRARRGDGPRRRCGARDGNPRGAAPERRAHRGNDALRRIESVRARHAGRRKRQL